MRLVLEWAKKNPEKRAAQRRRAYQKWRAQNPKIDRPIIVTAEGRLCTRCKERKPEDQFAIYRRGDGGISRRCKACDNAAHYEWREKNREHIRRKANKSSRRYHMKAKYGLSLEQIERMLIAQDGKCAICRSSVVLDGEKLQMANVDHCHGTGKVRELLCWKCNTGLGLFRDDPDFLAKASAYLNKHRT